MARLRCLALAALPVLVAAALSSPSPAAAAYGCEERAAEAQERHAALVAWLASLGSQGAASLVAPSKRCGDGPPEAAKALTEGEELLAVPFAAVLGPHLLERDPPAARAAAGQPAWVALALALVQELLEGEDSAYAPYIDALPEHSASPVFWDVEEDLAALQASPVVPRVVARRKQLLEAYTAAERALEEEGASLGDEGEPLSFTLFAWAVSMVWARSFPCPTEAAGSCLVPLADALALATEGGERGWDTDEEEDETGEAAVFVVRVGERVSYAKGDVVFADFGQGATADLFLATGEVVLENPSDTLVLAAGDLAELGSQPLRGRNEELAERAAKERRLIAEQVLGYSLSEPLVLQADGVRPEVLKILRVATIDDELAANATSALEEVVAEIEEDLELSDKRHAARVLETLRTVCRKGLAHYSTDLDTDEHSLRRAHNRPVPRPGSRAERRLAALRMRVAEKRILQATIEEAGRWLEGAAGYGTGTSLHDEL